MRRVSVVLIHPTLFNCSVRTSWITWHWFAYISMSIMHWLILPTFRVYFGLRQRPNFSRSRRRNFLENQSVRVILWHFRSFCTSQVLIFLSYKSVFRIMVFQSEIIFCKFSFCFCCRFLLGLTWASTTCPRFAVLVFLFILANAFVVAKLSSSFH